MGIVYCPKCHREAYRLREKDGNIEIIQGGKVLITTDKKSTLDMSISCPAGHPVKVEAKGDGRRT